MQYLDVNFKRAAITAVASLGAYGLYKLLRRLLHRTYLSDLQGPQDAHWLFGHMRAIMQADNSVLHEQWVQQFGPVVAYRGILGSYRLMTTDHRALNHILGSDAYEKPEQARRGLTRLLGPGVLVAEGDAHRKQRRALNPAFGPGQVRELSGVFLDKSNELRDVITSLIADHDTPTRIDIIPHISRATLDIIGLAGFGYDFNSLSREKTERNELADAFKTVFRVTQAGGALNIAMFMFPILESIPFERNRRVYTARKAMDRIGYQILNERKAALESEKQVSDRDVLSLLVKANTAADPSHRLSDEDVLAQIPTFLTAGHETTSTGTTWILYALSLRPDIQTRLRSELRANPLPTAASGCNPLSVEDLNALDKLPVLDAVVRETLRLHAPVPSTIRVAVRDDIVPLGKPYLDKHGKEQDSIIVTKGDPVFIPILLINRSKELWGEDANEWRPERWLDGTVPESTKSVPGVWGSMLTFLAGPHACIGYRFSLLETKILLHALVSKFAFELAVPVEDILKKSAAVTRPMVKGELDKGAQMPMMVSVVAEDS